MYKHKFYKHTGINFETVITIADLDLGWVARRQTKNEKWNRQLQE